MPIGLIHASWDGAPIEPWIRLETLQQAGEIVDSRLRDWDLRLHGYPAKLADYVVKLDQWKETAETERAEGRIPPHPPNKPLGPNSPYRPGASTKAWLLLLCRSESGAPFFIMVKRTLPELFNRDALPDANSRLARSLGSG